MVRFAGKDFVLTFYLSASHNSAASRGTSAIQKVTGVRPSLRASGRRFWPLRSPLIRPDGTRVVIPCSNVGSTVRRGEWRLFFSNCSCANANISSLTSAGTGTSIHSVRGRSCPALSRLGKPLRWRGLDATAFSPGVGQWCYRSQCAGSTNA
jgi:hypothetical protein